MPLLFALALMASPTLAVEEPQPRTQVAMGLGALDRGISLWLVRPKTWVGVEFDRLQWSWDQLDIDTFLSFHVRGALTVKRIFTRGPVFQLGYLSTYHISRQTEGQIGDPTGTLERRSGGSGGLEVGWGFLLRPWEKVSISFRQGVAYEFFEDNYSYYGHEYPYPTNQQASDTHWLRLQKARLWGLIHF